MTPTTLHLGLLACQDCGLVNRPPTRTGEAHCPRCGARLEPRRPGSLARTWALLSAAFVLYFPANLLPIMETSSLFGVQTDTILTGIAFLWHSGSWPLASSGPAGSAGSRRLRPEALRRPTPEPGLAECRHRVNHAEGRRPARTPGQV